VNTRRLLLALGTVILVALTRHGLEATMQRHMLVQLPVLFAIGMLLASSVVPSIAARGRRGTSVSHVREWNAQGIAGLVLAGGVVMTWMVPRALDAAVESVFVDALKMASLVLAGVIAWHSWRAASALVRTFVVGNAAWMMATFGMLLLDAPIRLCANYGASDQRVTGIAMIILTVAAVAATAVRVLFFPVSRTAPHPHG
jgi:cytochrome c oxidase assembly factor CtaG